uniref:Sushi domain-containing protein n=1 Tax=Strigamia maritima TaxID=126957 RepID=T1JGI8_STRMM
MHGGAKLLPPGKVSPFYGFLETGGPVGVVGVAIKVVITQIHRRANPRKPGTNLHEETTNKSKPTNRNHSNSSKMTHFWLWIHFFVAILLENGEIYCNLSLRSDITSGVFCRDPKGIANGRRLPEVGEIGLMAQGSQLHFSCTPGYVLDGLSKMVCGSEGSWEPPNKPTCKPVVCPELRIENGQIQPRKQNRKYYPGLMVQVQCNEGYRLKDKYMDLIECHMSGAWMRHIQATDEFLMNSDLPLCVEQTCTSPPQLPNSDIQIQGDIGWDGGYVLGSVVSYLCRYGYQIEDLRGSRLVCRKNGQWEPEHDDTALSKCVHGGCSRPLPILNGNFAPHLSTVYPFDATITYYCYTGFATPGHTTTFQCMADGKWSPYMQPEFLPICKHHP